MPGLSWGIGPVGVSYRDNSDDGRDHGQGIVPVGVSSSNNTSQGGGPPPSGGIASSGCVGPGQHQFEDGEILSCCAGLGASYDAHFDSNPVERFITCSPPTPPPCGNLGQPPGKATKPYQADGGCCPPTINRGGTCQYPIGFGSYKTQYMASGSTNGGATFAGHQECNQSNNCGTGGMDVGSYSSLCGSDDHYNWSQAKIYHIRKRGSWCAPGPARNYCPTNIGTVVSGAWYGAGGSVQQAACAGGTCDLRLQCTYSLITNPFDPLTVAAFTGIGASDLAGPNGIQKKYCDSLLYAGIGSGSPCAGFYTNTTKDYDYQQALRIGQENSDGSWATNATLFTLIANIAQGTSSVTSPLGKQIAQAMILNYCVTQNQNGWPSIQNIRTQINQWILQQNGNIGDDCQLLGVDIASAFCAINTTSTYCDCFNATNFGANIFTACQGKTITACTDINQLASSFALAPTWFAPQITTLKSYITPKCAVRACVSVTTDPTQPYLAPDVFNNMTCNSNIQLCLSSATVKGGMHAGSTIDQSCQTSIGITATVPNAPGSSAGCPPPPATPTVTQTGLSGNLQVVAQSNAPGPVGSGPTTFAVVASPSGSTTQVQTTGTPTGGLAQTVTSTSPGVSLQSSGGPVTQTLIPSPAPAPEPTVAAPVDNTGTYALAAGGGILGLSSSFFGFIVFCIILFLLFGGKKSAPKPVVIPISAYGL